MNNTYWSLHICMDVCSHRLLIETSRKQSSVLLEIRFLSQPVLDEVLDSGDGVSSITFTNKSFKLSFSLVQ